MIPAPNVLTQIDTLPGEEIEFGIGDPRWVMRTQAELYSDVTTAIIREYSTNAWDAHVMAGHTDPIEVTLPSVMNPFFVVRDHGVGMSIELFRTVYTQFGVSDKRESADTNGMLGYGSKSGVAYTTSFQVTSVCDGIKTVGVIQRKPDWSIVLKVVSQTHTDEPNGTEIRIPVHNTEEFVHKAHEFYKFWLPGRVLINGTAPTHYVGEKIAENFYYSKEWNTSYVVMGNVAYRIANPDALFRETRMNRVNFVAYVDDFKTEDGGAPVEFVPSREDLKYTDRTKATLQAIINQFEAKILATAKVDINSASTHAEAFLAWKKWTDVLGRNMFADLEYKGDKFQPDFKIDGYRYRRNTTYNSVDRIYNWNVEAMPRTMVVTEFDINMSSNIKRKVNDYVKQQGWEVNYVLFTPKTAADIESKWITKDKFITWADLKAALPKTVNAPRTGMNYNPNTGRVAGSWDYYTTDGFFSEKPLPTNAKSIYYIRKKREKDISVRGVLSHLGEKDAYVLLVPANRKAKLLRENPQIKEIVEYAKSKVVNDTATLLSAEAKEVMNLTSSTRSWLKMLDSNRVNDPELQRLVGLLAREDALTKAYGDNEALARQVGIWYNLKRYQPKTNDSIMKKYPLLSSLSTYRMHDDVYLYLNAAHAAKKEKNNGK